MAEVKQMYVYVGKTQAQKVLIKTLGGTSLGGKYFVAFEPNGTKHAFWFDTGSSVAPTLDSSWTKHAVSILVGDDASQVATKLNTALDSITEFAPSTVSGNELILTNVTMDFVQSARDIDTGFSFEMLQLGVKEESIGCIQGDVELSPFNYTTLEVKCHASGPTVVQEIITGIENPVLSFTLQETSKAKLEKVFTYLGATGTTSTTSNASKVFGFGTALLGKAKPFIPVRLHPVSKDAADKSEDWNIWKTNLSLDAFTFAAEDVATCGVSFKAFPDETKLKGHNVIMIGNASDAVELV